MIKPIITDVQAAGQAGLLTSGRYFIDITTATPLFFRAISLDSRLDWQTTYIF